MQVRGIQNIKIDPQRLRIREPGGVLFWKKVAFSTLKRTKEKDEFFSP